MIRPEPDGALPFWKTKTLGDLSTEEWESLCDSCGKCCLLKLEDADSGAIDFTNVACRLLDVGTCTCTRYGERKRYVSDCVVLTPKKVDQIAWMPSTCAYRLIAEGHDLMWWHHLVSGDSNTVHEAGVSVRGRAVPEKRAGDLKDHLAEWPRYGGRGGEKIRGEQTIGGGEGLELRRIAARVLD